MIQGKKGRTAVGRESNPGKGLSIFLTSRQGNESRKFSVLQTVSRH